MVLRGFDTLPITVAHGNSAYGPTLLLVPLKVRQR